MANELIPRITERQQQIATIDQDIQKLRVKLLSISSVLDENKQLTEVRSASEKDECHVWTSDERDFK